jgi:hypothetical protein
MHDTDRSAAVGGLTHDFVDITDSYWLKGRVLLVSRRAITWVKKARGPYSYRLTNSTEKPQSIYIVSLSSVDI